MIADTIFPLFVASDTFAFINTSVGMNKYKINIIPKQSNAWLTVKKKITSIITNILKLIK
jgi:hypothetical protein